MKKSNHILTSSFLEEIISNSFLNGKLLKETGNTSIKEHTYKYVREREILIPAHPPRLF